MTAPTAPAIAPSTAPSPGLTGAGELLTYRCAAMIPPAIAHAQQQRLGRFTKGVAERMPSTTPPIKAGFILSFIYVCPFAREDPLRCSKRNRNHARVSEGVKTGASQTGTSPAPPPAAFPLHTR